MSKCNSHVPENFPFSCDSFGNKDSVSGPNHYDRNDHLDSHLACNTIAKICQSGNTFIQEGVCLLLPPLQYKSLPTTGVSTDGDYQTFLALPFLLNVILI